MDDVCATDGAIVDRARAWCSMAKIPYFRFNATVKNIPGLDEKDPQKLLDMMSAARINMVNENNKIKILKHTLFPNED